MGQIIQHEGGSLFRPIPSLYQWQLQIGSMPTSSKIVTLLQVDDDLVFNAICKQHFKSQGSVELIQMTSIKAAESRLKEAPGIDVLMLDLSLPDRDGIEFLETLKDIGFAGKLIIVSSQPGNVIGMASTMATTMGLNLVARLDKPLTPSKMASLDVAISLDSSL